VHRKHLDKTEALRKSEEEYVRKNTNVIEFLRQHNDIEYIIVNYDDLVDGRLIGFIDRFVGQRLNYAFIDPKKRRSKPIEVRSELIDLFQEILELNRQNLTDLILNQPSVRQHTLWDIVRSKALLWGLKGRRFIFRHERTWRTYPHDW
jgi:hypothetical protein